MYWGLTPQQQPGSYQGGEMMMMKSVFWWRKPEYPEETTDLRQVTEERKRGGEREEGMGKGEGGKGRGGSLDTFSIKHRRQD